MKKNFFLTYILFILLLGVISCSTENKSIVSRAYHYTTARYNAYFNGREGLENSISQLEKSHVDDYDKVIPLYIYTTPSTVSTVSSSADVAIKKASKMITKHSLSIRGRQYNSWIDENYMLLGRAHFYKRDYKSSIQTFEYVAKMSKNEKETDPKEEKKRLKRYMLYVKKALKSNSHKWDAYLWLTRSYIENEQFDKAQTILDLLEFDEHFPKKMQGERSSLYADYYIQQDNYSPALINLEEAISNTRKKSRRARFLFATAQIYTELGNYSKAVEKYTQLLKINIPYEMEFKAKINRALLSGSEGSDAIRRELQKMLKDKKNKEYNDQIYYALANMDEKEGKQADAIKNYKLSVNSSVSNKKQKAKSCIRLADIYYKQPEYELAYAYYDTSLTLISIDYPSYDEVAERKNNLTDLVKNLRIVATEDSLQQLAKMNDKERDNYIDALVKAEMQKAVDKLKEQSTSESASASTEAATNPNTAAAWYFYNPNMVSQGKTQFVKQWGDRKLEDNWRRGNKSSISSFEESSDEELSSSDSTSLIVNGQLDPKAAEKLKEKLLKNIPLTEEQIKQSDEKIIEAYYNIGSIYKEQFSDYKRSVEAFEKLLQKYPENNYILPTYYQLYRTYLLLGNEANASKYKNLILSNYPESEYAKVILDPDYYKQKLAEQNRKNQMYDAAFAAYKSSNYDLAYANAVNALAQIQDSVLSPKLSYIKALSIGHTKPIEEYKVALNEVIVQFPKSEVAKEAKALLNYVNNPELLLAAKSYDPNIQGEHYYILVVPNTYVNIKKLTDTIASYNTLHYSADSLTVSNTFLNPETQMVVIKNFVSKEAALNYYTAIKTQEDLFSIIQPNKFDQSIITTANYTLLSAKKEMNTYMDFFNKNYVSQ